MSEAWLASLEDAETVMALKESKAQRVPTSSSAHEEEDRDVATAMSASKEEADAEAARQAYTAMKSSASIEAHSMGLSEARTDSMEEERLSDRSKHPYLWLRNP